MKALCLQLGIPHNYSNKDFFIHLLELRDQLDKIIQTNSMDANENDDIENDNEFKSSDNLENESEADLKRMVIEKLLMDKNSILEESVILAACLRVHDKSMGELGKVYSNNLAELQHQCQEQNLPWQMNKHSFIYFLRQVERNERINRVEGAMKSVISITTCAEIVATG